ncbi:hypothetical protein KOR34_35500 [Posidoniimonas corsicana]|uniref:Uncharacterized protein n=1 Tax=Posidoniimonas corsicana TaxID=1938618 RepID=A0A5C5V7C7_9BACT|nr:hypothetical protein [Posidoniimonas corsicana]TWT33717.1 hypothetical protein KOR34_35500 [Posidoniimonas corsicana]
MADRVPNTHVQLVVLTPEPGVADRVADRMTARRHIEGEGLVSVTGELNCTHTAVVRPRSHAPDWAGVVRTVRSTHRPDWLLAAGIATAARQPTPTLGPAPVGYVRDALGAPTQISLPLDRPSIMVAHAAGADAVADWPADIASACCDLGLALAILALVEAAPDDADPEWRNLAQQQSTAGKLGAAFGGLWRRPSMAKEAVSRLAGRWKGLDELVDLVERSAASDCSTIAPPRRS